MNIAGKERLRQKSLACWTFRAMAVHLEGPEYAREGSMSRSSLVAGCLIALTLAPTAAQQPTQAQRDALRAACRSDFMANCASVQPGGKEALECLIRNDAKLSPTCRGAVNAIATPASSPTAPAAAAPPQPSDTSPTAHGQSSMPTATEPSTRTLHPKPGPAQKTPGGGAHDDGTGRTERSRSDE